jgi:hypothetical protein
LLDEEGPGVDPAAALDDLVCCWASEAATVLLSPDGSSEEFESSDSSANVRENRSGYFVFKLKSRGSFMAKTCYFMKNPHISSYF